MVIQLDIGKQEAVVIQEPDEGREEYENSEACVTQTSLFCQFSTLLQKSVPAQPKDVKRHLTILSVMIGKYTGMPAQKIDS